MGGKEKINFNFPASIAFRGCAWKSIALGVGVGVVGGVIAYNAAKQEGATGKDLALETAKADNPAKRANERGFALQ